MGRARLAAGVADHNGWAVLVCVRVQEGVPEVRVPEVVDRRRVELIESGLPKQPYEHETQGMGTAEAERLVREVAESALHSAERALSRLQASAGEISSIALRTPPLAQWPQTVAEVHASYYAMARADAMLYHDALCKAAATLGIGAILLKRGDERPRAAEALGTSVESLDGFLQGLRATLGAPWQQDHQAATARAIAALGKQGKLKLPG